MPGVKGIMLTFDDFLFGMDYYVTPRDSSAHAVPQSVPRHNPE